MDLMHPYERLPLFTTGLLLALWLIAIHCLALARPQQVQQFLKKFPRNQLLGQIILAIGMAWFFLLLADSNGRGIFNSLAMDLGEFNVHKGKFRVALPIALILVAMSVRDFLAVRAVGLLGLMVAYPLLEAAFLEDPISRLFIPVFAYAMLTASLFWVGMPYLFRDAVDWVTADRRRWTGFSVAGLGYGVAMLVCAFAFWRGY
jgi:hypothetical protein